MTNEENFFEGIGRYDDTQEGKKKDESPSNEMIGRTSNRKLNEKWNIKIQINSEFFTNLFKFLREMKYDTIFLFQKSGIRIYTIDASNTHLSYTLIDKTELSEYINSKYSQLNDFTNNPENQEDETVIYVDMDLLEEMEINNKYPIDLYFDTIEKNKMYVVNSKTIESRRLNSTDNKDDQSLKTYDRFYKSLISYIKNESSFKMVVSSIAFKNVLMNLSKKVKKSSDKGGDSPKVLKVFFGKNDINFIVENEVKSSSIQMYGEDITLGGIRDVTAFYELKFFTKISKLNFENSVTFYVNENLPFIIEVRYGAGNIKFYYILAPRIENDNT